VTPSRLAVLVAVALASPVVPGGNDSSQPQPSAALPQPDPTRWESAIRAFEDWDSRNSPPKEAVLFVGSSSIVGWKTRECFPDLAVINRGFGGSHIADVNHYVPRIVQPYRPRVIVLYAGDNDIADGKSPQRVLEDYREFVRRVREQSADTPVIFVAIKPSRARWNLWPQMQEANRLVEAFTRTDARQFYADIATPMLGADGKPRDELLIADGLHLTEKGYRLWTDVVAPLLTKACRTEPEAVNP